MDAKLDEVIELYKVDKLLQAGRLLSQVKSAADLTDAIHARLRTQQLTQISGECREIRDVIATLDSADGWTLSYDSASTKVWYRREAHTSTHTMRVDGTIRAPLLNLVTLLYEADLYKDLLWFVERSEILAETGRLRRAAHFQLYAPFPLSPRDAVVYGFAVDGLDEDGCILVCSRSLRESDGIPIPPITQDNDNGKVVRANIHISGYELTPMGTDVTRVRFIFNIDPQLPFLPSPLINWSSRMLCRWSLQAMEARSRDLPASYQARRASKDIYRWFDHRLKTYSAANPHLFISNNNNNINNSELTSDDDAFDADAIPDGPSTSTMAAFFRIGFSPRSGNSNSSRGELTSQRSLTDRFFGRGSSNSKTNGNGGN